MNQKQERDQKRRLRVVLVGPAPTSGLKVIRDALRVRSSFRTHDKYGVDQSLLKMLEEADVVVSQLFTPAMARAASKLRFLHAVGAGIDAFSVDELNSNTTLANVYFHGPAIAEYVMMSVLALDRELIVMDSQLRRGNWEKSWIAGHQAGGEIAGKVLGVVGYGHIGKEVITKAKAFGMQTWAVTRTRPVTKPKQLDVLLGLNGLEELLANSDYMVISCPCTSETRGMIGSVQLRKMKKTACLINVSRAAIVDEAALYEALKRNRIRGAAIDVWYRYPAGNESVYPSFFPFHRLKNLIMTPHIAGWTKGTLERRFLFIAANIDRFAAGRRISNVLKGPERHHAIM
jgi:phosphoglycerate dehydrogenase-like enzyme